jgi:uncharacterized protein (DUF169 family)
LLLLKKSSVESLMAICQSERWRRAMIRFKYKIKNVVSRAVLSAGVYERESLILEFPAQGNRKYQKINDKQTIN